MNYVYVYNDASSYCEEFRKGMDYLINGEHAKALHSFQLAYESVKTRDPYHNKYASFCGLLRVIQGDYGGLILCRDAARSEYNDGDVFLNLARAEWQLNYRKKTVEAILRGLCIDASHTGLHKMQQQLGIRKRNPLPILSRKNCLNVMIGKIIRKKKSPVT